MSSQWRIFLVEDDEGLNTNIVNSLRKDGYIVQGVISVADAVRVLWSEEYDVVVCDVKLPNVDGFELLQWLHAYRPGVRLIMVGVSSGRTRALEQGAVSYLQAPLDAQRLKEELRYLLQQTGFSASLDSFDLLDVIQIINMSRKTIALLVNIGLEEQGVLRFQNGELVWAQYGILLGEEAFFALAAYKNGTVIHQQWDEQIVPNVKQPLARLILQALQYRAKYAAAQQESGKYEAVVSPAASSEYDDRPFVVTTEPSTFSMPHMASISSETGEGLEGMSTEEISSTKEWWQLTGKVPSVSDASQKRAPNTDGPIWSPHALNGLEPGGESAKVSPPIGKESLHQRADLPSWLTDQPTAAEMPALSPSASMAPSTATNKVTPAEWQLSPMSKGPEHIQPDPGRQTTGAQKSLPADTNPRRALSRSTAPIPQTHSPASAEWQPPAQQGQQGLQDKQEKQNIHDVPTRPRSGPLAGQTPPRDANGALLSDTRRSGSSTGQQRLVKRNHNYSALVSALQNLGYSINGFIAAAVVNLDGQPIAQVAIADMDISGTCKLFSGILKGVLQALEQESRGSHEDTLITSSDRHILLRLVGNEKNAFQVLITTREADPTESLEIMANVDSAISAALR